jgi:FkbM family methyltransferase
VVVVESCPKSLKGSRVGIREGLKWYYDLCGPRGVCAAVFFRLFGTPRELTITPKGSNFPVHLRLNTSDFCAYKDVLIAQDKQYDPGKLDFVPKTIVDAGAHIGMASILFARRYPLAQIIAIEPEPANFAALVRNTSPYKKINPIQAALWKEDGEICLGKSDAHPKGAFQVVKSGGQRVRAISMDTLMKEFGIRSVDLLKVDIEGAEREVFEVHTWIQDVRAIVIELHDRVKPGCRQTVETAAREFRSSEHGDVTLFVR